MGCNAMLQTEGVSIFQCGREITSQEFDEIRETVQLFPSLSRSELAATICEHLEWFTAAGGYKPDACMKLLEKLEVEGGRMSKVSRRPSRQEIKGIRKEKKKAEGLKVPIKVAIPNRKCEYGSVEEEQKARQDVTTEQGRVFRSRLSTRNHAMPGYPVNPFTDGMCTSVAIWAHVTDGVLSQVSLWRNIMDTSTSTYSLITGRR